MPAAPNALMMSQRAFTTWSSLGTSSKEAQTKWERIFDAEVIEQASRNLQVTHSRLKAMNLHVRRRMDETVDVPPFWTLVDGATSSILPFTGQLRLDAGPVLLDIELQPLTALGRF